MKRLLYPLSLILLAACSGESVVETDSEPIRINQAGYYATQSKTAVIEEEALANEYRLVDATTHDVVWQGSATRISTTPWSGREHHIIDFSSVTRPGNYLLEAGSRQRKVTIAQHPLHPVILAAMKAFYFQRSGSEILSEYAGQWSRRAAHPDTCITVHGSAATKARPEGTKIASAGGWYDAGDYNKYVVTASFALGQMMLMHQLHPNYFNALSLNIPESANGTPDMLDELLYELNWLFSMQDVADGGVYHKLTTPEFEPFVMPDECQQPRYVMQKSTSATLDFAATMAIAARVFATFPEHEPLAKKAQNAAINAWKWALKHPKAFYDQRALNEHFQPAIHTGAYGDQELRDEFFWAASELYFTTGRATYLNYAMSYAPRGGYTLPSWAQVDGLALMSWMVQATYGFSPEADRLGNRYTARLLEYCDTLLTHAETSIYDSPFGNSADDFRWGSLADGCCAQGISLLFAHRMTSDERYLTGALKCAEYILGRNAMGYCYVTGIGQKSPLNPHHRISMADGIDEPVPGLLVGGPNPGRQDSLDYPTTHPDEVYLDVTESFASNEAAINWNASLVTLLGGIEAALK